MAAIVRIFSSGILKYNNLRYFLPVTRCLASSKQEENEIDLDKPIQFSTSKAATWNAELSFSGRTKEDVRPWYQPLVVSLSLAVFMIYFFYLREENDIDENLTRPLIDQVDGLEEVQLRVAINYYKENDKTYDVSAMEKRLAEILNAKKQT